MWLPIIRLLAFVVLFGTGLHAESPSMDERQDDCSIGEVDRELKEDDRLEVGGVYFLPQPANCSGTLVSWHTCVFYSNLQPGADEYRMSLRVYRQNGSSYRFSNDRTTRVLIFRERNETEICIDMPPDNPIRILEGDRIGLQVDVECAKLPRRLVCPLHPNLNRSGVYPVFHLPDFNGMDDIDVSLVENDMYYTDVSINVRASIVVLQPLSSSTPTGGGLAPGEIAGVVTGLLLLLIVIAFLILLAVIVHHRLKKKKQKHLKKDNCDPQLGGNYRPFAGGILGQSYEDPEQFSDKKMTSRMSYRERFQKRMYSESNAYSIIGPTEEDNQGDLTVRAQIADLESTGHYEFNDTDDESPFYQPATMEDELRLQLLQLHIAEVPTDEIKIGGHLGSGQFGTVAKSVWQNSEWEMEVAVKLLKSGSTEEERVKFLQEAAIMGQFMHPNILKLHGVVTLSEPLMIVFELMHRGDLHHYLLSTKYSYGDSELPAMLLSFCRQVAAGMGYLANKSFVHRDLAARNILVSMDNVCKIADFGLSRDLQNEDYYISNGGKIPIKWTAPEALNFRKYSTASDIWSYGILLYEIWALGRKPYHDSTNNEVIHKVSSGYRLPPPSGCPRAIYQLMLQCWHPEAESRPTFFDILRVILQPDFQLLKWNPEDEAVYSQEARTLGTHAEVGKELFPELQNIYASQDPL